MEKKLRDLMEQEMVFRNYSSNTIRTYLGLLIHLAVYYQCPPEQSEPQKYY